VKVKLNAFRGEDRPGDVIDVPDADGATLIEHGAAFPADDTADADTDDADAEAQTVSGSATLTATTGTDTDAP